MKIILIVTTLLFTTLPSFCFSSTEFEERNDRALMDLLFHMTRIETNQKKEKKTIRFSKKTQEIQYSYSFTMLEEELEEKTVHLNKIHNSFLGFKESLNSKKKYSPKQIIEMFLKSLDDQILFENENVNNFIETLKNNYLITFA